MKSFENRRCPCVFVTVCDNPSKCVLNTLEFAHVETGQTPKERISLMKVTAYQSISCKNGSIISQVLSNSLEIMNLNEACLTNFADMIRKAESSIKPDTKVFHNNCWMHEITKYPN